MFRLQDFRQMRIVGLHQWPRLQAVTEKGHPEGNHGHGDGYVFQNSPTEMEVARGVFEVGLDEPEQIEGLGEDHPLADADEALFVALDVAREQHGERDQPVEEEVQGNDDAPVAANAIEIPGNFFGEVAGPDDEELREGQVDIEHDKGEGELAQIVLFSLAKNGFERLCLGQRDGDDDGEREDRVALADEEEQAVDRGVPGGVHRHDPVDDGGGHGERVDDDSGTADVFEFLDPVGRVALPISIALEGQGVEAPGVVSPDGEAEQADPGEGSGIEHGALEFDGVRLNLVNEAGLECGCDVADLGPEVEFLHFNDDDAPVEEDQWKGAAHCLKRPAEEEAPLAAGAVLTHEQGQAADAPAEGEHHAEDPGTHYVVDGSVREGQAGGDHREDCSYRERAHLPAVDESRAAEVDWERFGVRFVSHSVCPYLAAAGAAVLLAGILMDGSAGLAGAMPGVPSFATCG